MENIAVIKEQEVLGKDFKVYGTFDNPLFLAKDVAGWIEHSNVTDMVSRVDSDEVTKLNLGGLQGECNFLTEDGLYEVLMQSRKPIAKQFKTEVKKILKEIRKTGSYTSRPMTQTEMLLAQAQAMVEIERKANFALEKTEEMSAKIDSAIDVFTSPSSDNWKDDMNDKINKMCKDNGLSYSDFKGDLYFELENTARCNLASRQARLKERMKKAGATYKERQAISKIDIISRDNKLKLIFEGIVRKYQAKYL